jgi:hypothetical protein
MYSRSGIFGRASESPKKASPLLMRSSTKSYTQIFGQTVLRSTVKRCWKGKVGNLDTIKTHKPVVDGILLRLGGQRLQNAGPMGVKCAEKGNRHVGNTHNNVSAAQLDSRL